MRTGICLGVLILLAPATIRAQERPDLNGQWVLESAADSEVGAARALTVRQFFEREKDIRGEPIDVPYVTIGRLFQNEAQTTTHRIGIAGTVGGINADGSAGAPSTRLAVKWSGDGLQIETGSCSPSGICVEHDEAWSLDESGKLTITTTVRASGDSPTTTTFVYRRP